MRTAAYVALLYSTLALGAGRKPQEFQEPPRMSEEDLEAAKQRSKTSLNRFGEGLETKPKPFPWGAAALAGLVFLIATPFALRAYRRTASEISGNRSFGDSRRGE